MLWVHDTFPISSLENIQYQIFINSHVSVLTNIFLPNASNVNCERNRNISHIKKKKNMHSQPDRGQLLIYLCFFFLRLSWGFWLGSPLHSGTSACQDKGFFRYIGHGGRVNWSKKKDKRYYVWAANFAHLEKKVLTWRVTTREPRVCLGPIYCGKKEKGVPWCHMETKQEITESKNLPHKTQQNQPTLCTPSSQTAPRSDHIRTHSPVKTMENVTKETDYR